MKANWRHGLSFLCIGLMAAGGLVALADDKSAGESRTARTSELDYRGTLLVQVRVADLDRAVAFYRDVLDLEILLRRDDLRWAEVSTGIDGVKIGLGEGPEVKGSGSVSLNVGVKDVEAARTLLEKRGVTFSAPTHVVEGKVMLADFSDPDGNKIRLVQSLAS